MFHATRPTATGAMARGKSTVCASSACFPAPGTACLPSCACCCNSTREKRPICAARSTPRAPTKRHTWPRTAGFPPSPTRSSDLTRSSPWSKKSATNRLARLANPPYPHQGFRIILETECCAVSEFLSPGGQMTDSITIRGARLHNLKNVTLTIPKNQFVVLTGLSGSGKSTLGFDILYKESLRQYLEALGMVPFGLAKPPVDAITGLSPSISLDQRLTNHSPRSTVGTTTDVY